tara:strand:+ start:519 stop:737 length:219 start_codon:yes stop_codon:yes gene_type:complete
MLTKRNYKLTPSTYGFKVEMWNDFGMKRTVYENNVMSASEIIIDWWESSEEEFNKMNIQQKCINNLVKKDLK